MTFLTSPLVSWFELLMYILLTWGSVDVLSGRSVRVGRGVMSFARTISGVCFLASLVGIAGFLLRDPLLFRLGWLIIGFAGLVRFVVGTALPTSAGIVTELRELLGPKMTASS